MLTPSVSKNWVTCPAVASSLSALYETIVPGHVRKLDIDFEVGGLQVMGINSVDEWILTCAPGSAATEFDLLFIIDVLQQMQARGVFSGGQPSGCDQVCQEHARGSWAGGDFVLFCFRVYALQMKRLKTGVNNTTARDRRSPARHRPRRWPSRTPHYRLSGVVGFRVFKI